MGIELKKTLFKKGRALALLCLWHSILTLLLSGCGLETVTFLSAPNYYSGSGFLVIQDTGAASNDPRSFELLYRIFQSQTDALAASSKLSSMIANNSNSPASLYLQIKSNSGLNFKSAQFAFSDTGANPDPSLLTLSPSEEGINSQFQIVTGVPPSAWVTKKLVGNSSATPLASAVNRSISGGAIKAFADVSLINDPVNDIDYSPDSSTTALYPPSIAYVVSCVVAESSTDLITISYSIPAQLTSIIQLPSGP